MPENLSVCQSVAELRSDSMAVLLKAFIVLACGVAALAASDSLWKPGTEYQYELNARSLAGLPSKHGQYNGVEYGGIVRVQGISHQVAGIRLEQLRWSGLHSRMRNWWASQPSANTSLPGAESLQDLRLSGQNAYVKFENGMVSGMVLSKAMKDWEVNMLQGVASQMQAQISPKSANSIRSEESRGRSSGVFRVVEGSVNGRCEVLYEVDEAPAPVDQSSSDKLCPCKKYMQITKTRNFTNCEEYGAQSRGINKCPSAGNSCGSLWTRNSLTQIMACACSDSIQVMESVTSSSMQAELQLHKDSVAAVHHSVNMTLVHSSPIKTRMNKPKEPTIRLNRLGIVLNGRQMETDQKNEDDHSSEDSNSDESASSESVEIQKQKKMKSKTGKDRYASASEDRNSMDSSDNERNHKRKHVSHKSEEDISAHHKQQGRRKGGKHSDESNDESDDGPYDESNSVNESDEYHKKSSTAKNRKMSRKGRSASSSDDEKISAAKDYFFGIKMVGEQRNILVRRLTEELQKGSQEISQSKGPTTHTMERIAMAVQIARALNIRELRKVQDDLKQNSDEWKMFRDVISMCGSEPCVEMAIGWVKEGKMSCMPAQQMLARLPDRMSQPSKNILQLLREAYKSSKEPSMKIAAAVSMAQLAAQKSKSSAESAASFIASEMMKSSSNSPMRVGLAYALGETATSEAVNGLLKAARDEKLSPYQRAQAVLALTKTALRSPMMVRDHLLSLYHGPRNPAAVRMAAVSLLMYVKPSLPVWQRLAVSTFYEKDHAVTSYVWTALHTFAYLNDPVYQQQTKFARLVMPMARPMPRGPHLASNFVMSSICEELGIQMHRHFAFSSSMQASNVYFREIMRQAGLSFPTADIDVWAANPDDLVQSIFDVFENAIGRKMDKASFRPAQAKPAFTTRKIHEHLNIARRHLVDPEGHLRLTLKPFLSQMFLPFGNNSVNRMVRGASSRVADSHFGHEHTMQYLSGEEMSLYTFNEMGFPVRFRAQNPWLVRASAGFDIARDMSAHANVTFLYTSGLEAQVSVQAPWNATEYVAGVHGSFLKQLPATKFIARFDLEQGQLDLRVEPHVESWQQNNEQALLGRYSMQTFTASVDMSKAQLASESKSASNATTSETHQMSMSTMFENMSVTMRTPVQFGQLAQWLKEYHPVMGFWSLGKPLDPARVEVVVSKPQAFNISLAMASTMKKGDYFMTVFPEAWRWKPAADEEPQPTTTTVAPQPESQSESPKAPSEEAASQKNQSPRHEGDRQVNNGSIYFDSGIIDDSTGEWNASTINAFRYPVNGSRPLYVMTRLLSGLNGGNAYALSMNFTSDGAQTTPYSAILALGSSFAQRLQRIGFFLLNNKENTQMSFTTTAYTDAGSGVSMTRSISSSPHLIVRFELADEQSQGLTQIGAMLEAERTPKLQQSLMDSARNEGCMKDSNSLERPCQLLIASSNILNQYNLTVDYNERAETRFGEVMTEYLKMLKSYLESKNMIGDNFSMETTLNQITAGISMQPDESVEGWMKTHRTMTTLKADKSGQCSLFPKEYETIGQCGVNPTNFVTFDGQWGSYKMSNCWHLIAKDCSGKSRLVVLGRQGSMNESSMEIEINVDNYQVIKMNPEGTWLNGILLGEMNATSSTAAIEVRDGIHTRVLNMVRSRDGSMLVQLPDHGMTVSYSNATVKLEAGHSLRGRMCGICGDFDGSLYREFRNPKDKIETTSRDFVASYVIDDNCSKGRSM